MALVAALSQEKFWFDKSKYDDAEAAYYQKSAQPLQLPTPTSAPIDTSALKFFEKKMVEFHNVISNFESRFNAIESRLIGLENTLKQTPSECKLSSNVKPVSIPSKVESKKDADDDVDLFGSDSEEENEEAVKIREERLAAYNAKKSKKPQLIAKSNIILDIKPWDDETDMKKMEEEVRKIETDGLIWGAAKLVPLAYGIHKLQISCVVEDDKVSVDWLQEEIEKLEDYVQSIDIAAFNKV
ncbi:probable elongation factor 1-delta isoform X2 [Agrilus planipennis]|uniref:Probable elongation factor 1-delta isoform X2 n=1 Tax=Agrilus planipennis TaxID=224129 RepID=A0A1W4WRQ2_AGRPL|nr:probable elongation factor 1-delta isoform X2 [Agrilus planipennis]